MRYNHRLHRQAVQHHPKHHRHQRLTSLLVILGLIIVLAALSRYHAINYTKFYSGFALSLGRVITSYIFATLLAIVLALIATKNHYLESILLPILDVAQSFPSLALLPLLISFFGRNSIAVILILITVMVWPITFSMIGFIKTQRQDLSEAATIYGATGTKRLLHFTLPALVPALLTGSIVAWGEAWDSLVGAEIISSVRGVGTYLGTISAAGDITILLLAITLYLLLIFILNELIWMPLLKYSTRYQAE